LGSTEVPKRGKTRLTDKRRKAAAA
jgi:hypothetical protein